MFNFFNELIADYGLETNIIKSFNIINMSNKVLYLEGHCGVLSISKEEVLIRTKKCLIKVVGNNLLLKRITKNTLLLEGKIKQVESV